MTHDDHVGLLRRGISGKGGSWADLGSGEGAFTLALRELLGPEVVLYSLDRDRARLARQRKGFAARFPGTRLDLIEADFLRPLTLPPLDGLLLANSLHFVQDKDPLLRRLRTHLKPAGCLLLVEYNVDSGNPWVPFPLSFSSFQKLAARAGFAEPELLAAVPSRFLREIYAALTRPIPPLT